MFKECSTCDIDFMSNRENQTYAVGLLDCEGKSFAVCFKNAYSLKNTKRLIPISDMHSSE